MMSRLRARGKVGLVGAKGIKSEFDAFMVTKGVLHQNSGEFLKSGFNRVSYSCILPEVELVETNQNH